MKRINFLIFILILSGFNTGIVSAVRLSSLKSCHPASVITLPDKPDKKDTNITDTGRVEIIQDPRIAALVKKHIAINKRQKGIPGYRVQIFFGSKRRDAFEVKADFLKKHPDINAYTKYDEPYFKVRVGDFRILLKVQKCHEEILRDFPNSFIVQDLISMPFLD